MGRARTAKVNLVKRAARNVLKNGFHLQKGETFVIICDYNNKFFSDALEEAVLRMKAKPVVFMLEDFGKRPFHAPKEIIETLQRADAGTICATDRLGEVGMLRRPIYDAMRDFPIRFASMPGINREAVEMGLNCDFQKVAEFTDRVFDVVKRGSEMRVLTEKGTNLIIDVSYYRWVNCNGILKPGVQDDNFPEGEVFTTPYDINGRIVVDGVLGDIFDVKYGIITEMPLTIDIKDCYAVRESIKCRRRGIRKDITDYLFHGDANACRVGEVALGTNIYLHRIIGNLLQDEKFPSFHLAFGNPYPNDTGAEWTSKEHIDMVILSPDVYIDSRQLMRKGKYLL